MTLTLRALPVLAILALAACEAPTSGSTPPDAPPATGGDAPAPVLPDPSDDTCGASDLSGYIGQPASALDAARFASPVRVIRPGDAVTMDFNPQRLNVELDEQDAIARLRCG